MGKETGVTQGPIFNSGNKYKKDHSNDDLRVLLEQI